MPSSTTIEWCVHACGHRGTSCETALQEEYLDYINPDSCEPAIDCTGLHSDIMHVPVFRTPKD